MIPILAQVPLLTYIVTLHMMRMVPGVMMNLMNPANWWCSIMALAGLGLRGVVVMVYQTVNAVPHLVVFGMKLMKVDTVTPLVPLTRHV